MKNKQKNKKKRGFTLVELIVVMSIIGILALLAAPSFIGKTEEANRTKHIANARILEDAAERYFIDHGKWPRGEEEPYTPEEVSAYAERIFDITGEAVVLEEGHYWNIDYEALQPYVKLPSEDDRANYVLRNPVGTIYYLDGLTDVGKNRNNEEFLTANKPTALISATSISGTLESGFVVGQTINWSHISSTTPSDTQIVEAEWTNKQDVYTEAGTYQVGLRVKNSKGIWSDWVYRDVKISGVIFTVTPQMTTGTNINKGTITWNGDLAGKTVAITSVSTYRAGGGPNYNQFTFKDKNGATVATKIGGASTGGEGTFTYVMPATVTSIYFTYYNVYGSTGYGYFVSIRVVE